MNPGQRGGKRGPTRDPMPEVFDLIGSIAKRTERLVTQTLGESNLTPAQYLVLASLQEKDGRPLGELSEALRCSKSTITGIADTMERKGLVERQPNPADRRSHLLVLTQKGRILRRSTPGLEEFYEGCTLGMEAVEFQRLRDLLIRLDRCMSDAGVGLSADLRPTRGDPDPPSPADLIAGTERKGP